MKNIERGKKIFLDQANIALFNSASLVKLEPKTIDKAWNHEEN
jgi:hypothetical protein